MTLEPDPAAVLVHERLQQAVSAMPVPDIEAGWAALAARLDAPLAPVVPLRAPKRGRIVALAIAAALMLAGSAFAAVAHFGDGRTEHVAPVVPRVHVSVTGPHAHAPFAGPPATTKPTRHHERGGSGSGSGTGTGSGTSTSTGSGDGGSAPSSGDGGGTTTKPGDDPTDRDQGTGNDGHHNDQGGGNDGPEGSSPSTSHSGSNH